MSFGFYLKGQKGNLHMQVQIATTNNTNNNDSDTNRGNPGFIVLPILFDAIGFTILGQDSSAADWYSASLTERPSRRKILWVAKRVIRGSCVTTSTVRPELCRSDSNCITAAPLEVSRLPVGSSARIRLGLFTRARAIATRCC